MTSAPEPQLAMEASDERFAEWMQGNLYRAAVCLGVTLGDPTTAVFGWRMRSLGAPVDGDTWLRVTTERPDWAQGDGWLGNAHANALTGIAKPSLLEAMEWEDDGRVQRAEVLTRLPGAPVSPTDVLHEDLKLPDSWWHELRTNLDRLRTLPNHHSRHSIDPETIYQRSNAVLTKPVIFGPRHRHPWETVHGDLHWGNLLGPQFGIVDWELWGHGPAGMDAATLLCHSLLVPRIAARVREMFADVLNTETGKLAQLTVIANMLHRIAGGDYPELEQPLRRLANTLLDAGMPPTSDLAIHR